MCAGWLAHAHLRDRLRPRRARITAGPPSILGARPVTSVRLSDALRVRYLALLEHNLRGKTVPGGDVAAWVAPVPTAALVEILLHPPELTRALVFAAVGEARLRTVHGLLVRTCSPAH